PLDARTDLYAFGILLFYMLLGKLPFDATSNGGEFEIMEKQVRDPAPKPHELDSCIPLPLSNLILKLLEKNKQHRPESAAVVRAEIENMLEQLQFLGSSQKVSNDTVKVKKQQQTSTNHASSGAFLTQTNILQQWVSYGRFLWQKSLAKLNPNIQKYHSDLSIIALVFVMLGTACISVLGMAESTATQTQAAQKKLEQQAKIEDIVEKPVVKPAQTEVTKAKVIQETVAPKTVKIQPKPTVKPKPKAKSKVKRKRKAHRRTIRSLPYSLAHTVERNDNSKVNKKKHEFLGGSHLFYPELKEKGWLSSFKRGDSTLLFDKPTSISKIIIHKASVGKLDFKHGFIHLEVKPENESRWKRIFEQEDTDIEQKVTIEGFAKDYPSIEGVRIKFKTQEPITIGPIDLLK
ncbi:MAG: hypothetical protein R8M14_09500, partial [Ghiorsea sp.]